MRMIVIGALLLFALGGVAMFFFFSAPELVPNPTECERDCLNDSGGVIFCTKFCKENGSYGPQKK